MGTVMSDYEDLAKLERDAERSEEAIEGRVRDFAEVVGSEVREMWQTLTGAIDVRDDQIAELEAEIERLQERLENDE